MLKGPASLETELEIIVCRFEDWRNGFTTWELPKDYPARFYAVRDIMSMIFALQASILQITALSFQQYEVDEIHIPRLRLRIRARNLHRRLVNDVESIDGSDDPHSPDVITFETFNATPQNLAMYHTLYG